MATCGRMQGHVHANCLAVLLCNELYSNKDGDFTMHDGLLSYKQHHKTSCIVLKLQVASAAESRLDVHVDIQKQAKIGASCRTTSMRLLKHTAALAPCGKTNEASSKCTFPHSVGHCEAPYGRECTWQAGNMLYTFLSCPRHPVRGLHLIGGQHKPLVFLCASAASKDGEFSAGLASHCAAHGCVRVECVQHAVALTCLTMSALLLLASFLWL